MVLYIFQHRSQFLCIFRLTYDILILPCEEHLGFGEFVQNSSFSRDLAARELTETVSAFLNSDGGVILVGVQTDRYKRDKKTELLKPLKVFLNVPCEICDFSLAKEFPDIFSPTPPVIKTTFLAPVLAPSEADSVSYDSLASVTIGNSTMKVAPLPNSLSAYILPPCSAITP